MGFKKALLPHLRLRELDVFINIGQRNIAAERPQLDGAVRVGNDGFAPQAGAFFEADFHLASVLPDKDVFLERGQRFVKVKLALPIIFLGTF